jgi:beta-lactamase class C
MLNVIFYALIDLFIIEPFIASNIGFIIYRKSAKRFELMSAQECLAYSFKKKPNIIVTIGTIQNGNIDWQVYKRDGIQHEKQLHTYEIASITKTMTGTLVACAERDGKLCIDDTIDQYLSLPKGKQYPTIRNLLTHTSGYKSIYVEKEVFKNIKETLNILSGVNKEVLLRRIGKVNLENKPYEWRYSNFNFAILGVILEEVYGMQYKDLVNHLLQKHGLSNSHISTGNGDLNNYLGWQNGDAYMAGGAVASNIEDMLAYAQLQLNGGEPFIFAHEAIVDTDIMPALCATGNAMGYGWMIDTNRKYYWHNGCTPGYKTYIGVCPETQTAVVVLSNSNRGVNAHHLESNIGVKMLDELQAKSVA